MHRHLNSIVFRMNDAHLEKILRSVTIRKRAITSTSSLTCRGTCAAEPVSARILTPCKMAVTSTLSVQTYVEEWWVCVSRMRIGVFPLLISRHCNSLIRIRRQPLLLPAQCSAAWNRPLYSFISSLLLSLSVSCDCIALYNQALFMSIAWHCMIIEKFSSDH